MGATLDPAQGRGFMKLIKWLSEVDGRMAGRRKGWRRGIKYVQTFKYPMKPVKLLPQNNCACLHSHFA